MPEKWDKHGHDFVIFSQATITYPPLSSVGCLERAWQPPSLSKLMRLGIILVITLVGESGEKSDRGEL